MTTVQRTLVCGGGECAVATGKVAAITSAATALLVWKYEWGEPGDAW